MDADRPRLLYVLTSFNGGGAEWGLLELLDGGAFAGFEVAVAALVQGEGAQIEALRARGVEPVILSPAARPTLGALVGAGWRLRRLLRSGEWRAVVFSLPHANILGRLLLPHRRRRPLVLSFEHNIRLARPFYETLYRATSRRVDWLLADCDATQEAALVSRYREAPKHRDVLPLVRFPPDRLNAAPPFCTCAEEPRRLVTAGRLSETKNQGRLIDLLHAVRRRGVDARLTIFGEGPLRSRLEARVAALGLQGAVALPGRVPRWWEGPADVFVLASRHEGLCIAALEAMAAGLPIAAPTVGALSDYGAAAGMLTLGDDLEADAVALQVILNDPRRLEVMRDRGFAVIGTRYSCAAVDRLYERFSERLRAACEAG